MTLSVSGNSITFNDASTQASAQVGMKNRIINGGLILNQRGYVSGTALGSVLAYGHDRFKGGASGGTYTFTQGALGVNTTITITAGSLIQVVEGCNVAEGGTYVLSWTGTAQGRLNGGSYGASGTVTVTGWTPGANLNVEFNTGTLGNVQLEKGSTATSFDYRPYGTELALCQRYYQRYTATGIGVACTTVSAGGGFVFPVPMRVSPTIGNGSFTSGGGTFAVTNTANTSTVLYNAASNWTVSVGIAASFDAASEL